MSKTILSKTLFLIDDIKKTTHTKAAMCYILKNKKKYKVIIDCINNENYLVNRSFDFEEDAIKIYDSLPNIVTDAFLRNINFTKNK